MTLSFSLEVEDNSLEKTMETLTHKEVFIRFLTRIKWLKPTKDLSHLILPKMGPNWLINPTSPTN